jgi:Protein kinase domain/WD domain, G-beta repeat
LTAQVGPYRIVRELARGGMGAVYEVEHEATGARYALKTLRFEALGDAQARRRFAREALALAEVHHPHVVRVHAADLEASPPYLVQALLPGGSLRDRLREGPLPAAEAAQIAIKLTGALAAVHARGVLHRDLKPDNVLLDDRGEPRLTDFGLAKRPDGESQRLTKTGALLGTPAYMAPEQGAGEPCDERTDIYGLAAMLYALLSGRPPFEAPSLINLLDAVLHRAPQPLPAEVPGPLRAVVTRALAKRPDERYPDMAAFGAALEQALSGDPRADSPARVPWLAALGLIGLVAFGLLLAAARPWSREVTEAAGPTAAASEDPADTSPPVPAQPVSAAGDGPSWDRIDLPALPVEARYLDGQRVLTLLDDGRVVAFDAAGEPIGDGWSLEGVEHSSSVQWWSVTPGSERLVWATDDVLRVADPISGAELWRRVMPGFRSAACARDGRLFACEGDSFLVFDEGFEPVWRLEDWADTNVMALSDDDRWVAYTWRASGLLRLGQTDALGPPLPALQLPRVSSVRWSPNGERLAVATADGLCWMWVRPTGELEDLTWVAESLAPGSRLLFSPHGRRLAATAVGTGILRWDLDRGVFRGALEGEVVCLDLSLDGRWVLLAVHSWQGSGPGLVQLPVEGVFGD